MYICVYVSWKEVVESCLTSKGCNFSAVCQRSYADWHVCQAAADVVTFTLQTLDSLIRW